MSSLTNLNYNSAFNISIEDDVNSKHEDADEVDDDGTATKDSDSLKMLSDSKDIDPDRPSSSGKSEIGVDPVGGVEDAGASIIQGGGISNVVDDADDHDDDDADITPLPPTAPPATTPPTDGTSFCSSQEPTQNENLTNSCLGLDEEESGAGSYPPTNMPVDDTIWPSMQDLNTRLRRVITAYQRNYKKEELKLQQKAKVRHFYQG